MNRQPGSVLSLLLLSLAGLALNVAEARAEGRPPNIVHIHADDFKANAVHALGNEQIKTPNLDALVGRGLVFTHCYTQGSMIGAVCLPSRTMLLTGRSWRRISPNTPAAETLPSVLSSVGYQTWHMGKSGNEFRVGIQAFDTNLIDDARALDDGPQSRSGSSRRHADAVIEFLGKRDTSKPFYLYVAPPVPHDPRVAEPQFMKMYDPKEIKLSDSFLPLHPWDNGEMTVRDEALAPWPRTPEDTRKQLAEYYACVTGLDHHIGRIVAKLKEVGELDRTLIFVTGDNGLSMGDHGLFGKQNLYEFGGMHVPLIVAGPGVKQGKTDALVYLMDLFPTFCSFAGAKPPATVEGKSLHAVATGNGTPVREFLYTGYRDGQRSIRDARWKLIRYPLVDKTQLFDLENDPLELVNLADRPEHAAKVATLMEKLQGEMDRHADPNPLKVANPKPAEWKPPAPGSLPKNAAKKAAAKKAARKGGDR